MFFCLDTKEPKDQGCTKMAKKCLHFAAKNSFLLCYEVLQRKAVAIGL